MNAGFYAAVGLLAVLSAGCNKQTRHLPLPEVQGQASMLGPQVSVEAAAQAYILSEVTDVRRNPDSLGMGFTGGKNILALLQEALVSSQPGTVALYETAEEAGQALPRLHLRLRKAYLSAFATTIQGTVVIEATVLDVDGVQVFSRSYRGQEVNTNWMSADGEYRGVLREAFQLAFAELWQDLQFPPVDELVSHE